ncbi:hypothetical protein GCM10010387_40420 [Streptomyces inusitatus]|uniref:Cell wall-active antibiotics response LiaF-like C-terminal domain-containing protein n=1 Tax=Streptomyces inusitatus TaxID=68221 RepID=A0A918QEH0_9ACTN|nr:DUF1707 domain-containing protein [Streptomyces inusitatus]GGZ42087.1 hypothetical protein GCM10010387_40420 [Streptomyces inusitatus]
MDLEKQPQKPVAPLEPGAPSRASDALRASDADRDRIADILRDALAEGRLDPEEHSERIDRVYRAKTVGELQPIVQDLPAVPAEKTSETYAYGPEAEGEAGENLVAVFSSSVRKGRWRVGRRTNAFALFGNIELDLTQALFEQRTTVINATSVFGNVEVRVPENITLRGNGNGIFGNFEVSTLEAANPDAPVVIVNGYSVFGNVEARPKRGHRVSDLQDRLRKYLG